MTHKVSVNIKIKVKLFKIGHYKLDTSLKIESCYNSFSLSILYQQLIPAIIVKYFTFIDYDVIINNMIGTN